MKRLFTLTPQARTDLREILSEIAEDSLDSADRLRPEIYQGLQRLGKSPGIGHYHEELLDKRYRFWNFYSYVVAYRWENKPIQIIAVVHGRREIAAHLSARPGLMDESASERFDGGGMSSKNLSLFYIRLVCRSGR